jgi:hypothetical protein
VKRAAIKILSTLIPLALFGLALYIAADAYVERLWFLLVIVVGGIAWFAGRRIAARYRFLKHTARLRWLPDGEEGYVLTTWPYEVKHPIRITPSISHEAEPRSINWTVSVRDGMVLTWWRYGWETSDFPSLTEALKAAEWHVRWLDVLEPRKPIRNIAGWVTRLDATEAWAFQRALDRYYDPAFGQRLVRDIERQIILAAEDVAARNG